MFIILYPRAFVDLLKGDDAELQTAIEESLLNVWCVNACITIIIYKDEVYYA